MTDTNTEERRGEYNQPGTNQDVDLTRILHYLTDKGAIPVSKNQIIATVWALFRISPADAEKIINKSLNTEQILTFQSQDLRHKYYRIPETGRTIWLFPPHFWISVFEAHTSSNLRDPVQRDDVAATIRKEKSQSGYYAIHRGLEHGDLVQRKSSGEIYINWHHNIVGLSRWSMKFGQDSGSDNDPSQLIRNSLSIKPPNINDQNLPADEYMYYQIPHYLKDDYPWVCWSYEKENHRTVRRLRDPKYARLASIENASHWGSHAEARSCACIHRDLGCGFMLKPSDPVVIVDLYDCYEDSSGFSKPYARDAIERLESYSEILPSGTGIRIMLKGAIPPWWASPDPDIKIRSSGFIPVTGWTNSNIPREINHSTEFHDWLRERMEE